MLHLLPPSCPTGRAWMLAVVQSPTQQQTKHPGNLSFWAVLEPDYGLEHTCSLIMVSLADHVGVHSMAAVQISHPGLLFSHEEEVGTIISLGSGISSSQTPFHITKLVV